MAQTPAPSLDSALSSRAHHLRRVNAVIDYIEAHLDEDLSLENLAAVAHFSPFHFHRIFTGYVGETDSNAPRPC